MTDRPILFSGPMVRALLDGCKTQTRRVVKIAAVKGNKVAITAPDEHLIELEAGEFPRGICHYESTTALSGPYRLPCAVGDRLWVRETWAPYDDIAIEQRERDMVFYRADDEAVYETDGPWRSPIHMPRWASRLTLIVTDVRVQRLQEISEADAIREGVTLIEESLEDPRMAFKALWDSLNAARGFGWNANPWVCALTFTVHPKNTDQLGDA